jgi:hypothetical protein
MKGETRLQIHGIGPYAITDVDAADDRGTGSAGS